MAQKCFVLKSGHNFGQMSFFSGTLIRTDVAFGQMSLSDRSRVTNCYNLIKMPASTDIWPLLLFESTELHLPATYNEIFYLRIGIIFKNQLNVNKISSLL